MRFWTLCFMIVYSATAWSQTVITGQVTDRNGQPIPGANITLQGTFEGASSDANGHFSFTTYQSDTQAVAISYVGYKPFAQILVLRGDTLRIEPKLKEEISALKAVVVNAGSFEASDENKTVVLSPIDMVTTAGSNGDVFAALQELPGTQQVGEQEGMFVRGGSQFETAYIIDGLLVQAPFFSSVPDVPQRGRFSPFEFKGTVFSTGGYSAQYGQALSSVVVLETQDMPDKTQSNLGLLPVGVNAGHQQVWDNTAAALQLGYTNVTPYFWINNTRLEFDQAPEGYNAAFNFRQQTSDDGLWKVYATYDARRLGLQLPNIEQPDQLTPFAAVNKNTYLNTSLKEGLNDNWAIYAGASYADQDDQFTIDGQEVITRNQLAQTKVMATRFLGNLSALRTGAEWHWRTNDMGAEGGKFTQRAQYRALFSEADIYLTNRLAARAGLRYEYTDLQDAHNLAPRLSLSYKTGTHNQVSLAYGHFYQTPQAERNAQLFPFFQQLPQLEYERATHYIANFQHLTDHYTFRIEGYWKEYDQLVQYDGLGNDWSVNNLGEGYARGIDLFWRDKKTLGHGEYWISYSYLDTERQHRDFPAPAMPAFASSHNLSVVYKHWLEKLNTSVNVTYNFASGRPYYNPNNPVFHGDRTPNFHNLSFAASYLTTLWDHFTIVFIGVNNVLGIDNIFSYRYNSDGSYRQAIKAQELRTLVVGVFISFDHTKNP